MKQTISILGCGWLGMALALELTQKGFDVKGSTRSNDQFETMRLGGILPYSINLDQPSDAMSDFLASDVLLIAVPSKNVENFKHLIYTIEQSSVKKVLFISSTSVYPNTNQFVAEDFDIPHSALSEIENLFKGNKRFKTTILRFGGLFGYDRKPGKFHPTGKVIDNPEGYVNLIHRDDCIRIIHQIIEQDVWEVTLNACADSHPTRRDFYTKEAHRLGLEAPQFNENSLCQYKIIGTDKLKSLLNFSYKYADLMAYSGE